jgi:hypothetical protein
MSPQEIADLAFERARIGFDESVQAIIDAADNDTDRLVAASRIVGSRAEKAGDPEHIAFTYISAAFKRAAGRAASRSQPSVPAPSAPSP